jgi:Fe-S cluster assembly iron-binding protein IscA
MISVTDRAKDLLYGVLQEAEEQVEIPDDDEVGIRLAPANVSGNGGSQQVELGLGLDRPQEGDQIFEHHGKKILILDEAVGDLLDGATIDAVDTPDGQRLTISQDAANQEAA